MWTIERLTALCVEYCGRCGVEFNSPVIINPRTSRRLGACHLERVLKNGRRIWVPVGIEISKLYLSVATDEEIQNTVAHECAHYVATAITHESHGHDDVFRFYCAKIGTKANTAQEQINSFVAHNDKIFKYSFFCSECGQFVGGRARACQLTRHPDLYQSHCCKAKLNMVQNW